MSTSPGQPSVQTYLFFHGTCEQAVEFYRRALGARVQMMMRYKESPEPPPPGAIPDGWDDKVMHVSFRIGGTVVMASDGCTDQPGFGGFSLSLAVPTDTQAEQVFAALAEGGQVRMPLGKTF